MNGMVSLIGAGPGNVELITVLGQRRLREADVILYDRLIDPAIMASSDAEKINVGKLPHHHQYSQYEINDLLVKLASEGKRVARLKAGDPYVFGRGGEEAQYLKKHGIEVEVVPGITSAIAGLASVGIPITHRDFASSFHIITAHKKKDGSELDWQNIANSEGTLVFLMGMEQLANISTNLIGNGRSPQTPVAVIQWATQWRQKSIVSDLANVVTDVNNAGLGSPALITVGDVVKVADELMPQLPLQGKRIMIPYSKRKRMFNKLTDAGASLTFFKRPEAKQVSFELPDINEELNLDFDNPTSATLFLQHLFNAGVDIRQTSNWHFVTNGPKTRQVFEDSGILPVTEPVLGIKILNYREYVIGHHQSEVQNTIVTDERHNSNIQVDLDEVDSIIFPSTNVVEEISAGVDAASRKSLVIFALGQKVADRATALGWENVVELIPNIETLVSQMISNGGYVHD
ncbi:uroporphyrinogen-III C-methyltransferase [Lentilactobacillus kosonis]|uniref:Uroporphyrinogen-III C-methyltransferase n=1 Tax=Lentilactobacillus kosonis TaxID=2810561 RepID=A0A401FMQ2_9LACO|nr:uroporphyrinogen-III C-methyltransferase [Lentilactobacillus kosonis]GAY73654.1 uroporphyrinogen-III methyltransferase [Lentilactobacillus kosonis]